MTVLVAHGSTGGSTAEIAEWIADEMRDAGLTVDVRAAADVHDITGYAAIVLGGALYGAGWHRDARHFSHRFAGQPARGLVWLFSSGPLDPSAEEIELPPVPHVTEAMGALQARGHITFGGRLSPEARGWLGFVVQRMIIEGHDGDFRNPTRVRAWARRIAAEITTAGGDRALS